MLRIEGPYIKYNISNEFVRTGRHTPSPGSDRARFKLIIVVMTHERTDRHIAAYICGLLRWLPCRCRYIRPPCRSYLRRRAPRTQCITPLMFAVDFAAGIYVGMPGAIPFQVLPQQNRSCGALHLTHAPPSPAAAQQVGAPQPQHCS